MKELNQDINIFIACHKESYVPNNKYLIPVQVGAELAKTKLDMCADNTGDNISELNPSFCELTAQYWAWKNVDCEYYGFFHYRRYLSFADYIGPKHAAYGDLFLENMTDDVLKGLKLEENHMKELIEQYDMILPRKAELKYEKKSWNTTYKHYKESPQHEIKDLDDTVKIIHDLYPQFDKYVKKALHGKKMYFLNMYIMKKKYFFEYMEWLFPILTRFHEQRNYDNASLYSIRTPGLIAERMVPIFMLYLKDRYPDLRVKELQNTYFYDSDNPYPQPKHPNKIGICLASDNNYAKHLGVALQSIVDNGSVQNYYDIIVFDNKLDLHYKNLLTQTVAAHENISLRFIKTAEFLRNKNLFERGNINKSSYLRFAILDLLKYYSRVIYLDCDLVVNTDIASLYQKDLGENYVAAVRDINMAAWNNLKNDFGEKERAYNRDVIGLDRVFDYFNAGVMVFNVEEMSKHFTTDGLFKLALERDYEWQDQDILNKVCNGKVLWLENNWNYIPKSDIDITLWEEFKAPKACYDDFLAAKANPYIVHFAGRFQPMYCRNVDKSDVYWKYARNSLFYEEILGDMFVYRSENTAVKFRTKVKRKLKKMFPADTARGRFARRFYHFIRRR